MSEVHIFIIVHLGSKLKSHPKALIFFCRSDLAGSDFSVFRSWIDIGSSCVAIKHNSL